MALSGGNAIVDNLGDHTATENLNMSGHKITGLGAPTVGTDAAHKTYVDGKFGTLTNTRWCRTNGTQVICDQVAPEGGDNLGNHMATATLNMNSMKISGLATPTAATDAAPKSYVDGKFGTVTNGRWCVGNSSGRVECTSTTPVPAFPATNCTQSAALGNFGETICPAGKYMAGMVGAGAPGLLKLICCDP